MKSSGNHKSHTPKKKRHELYDEVSQVGLKKGLVKKERKLAHLIDQELRDIIYR